MLTVQNTVQLTVARVSRPLIFLKCIRYFQYHYYACVYTFQEIICVKVMCMVKGTWGSYRRNNKIVRLLDRYFFFLPAHFLSPNLKKQLIVNSLFSSFLSALMSLMKIHTHRTNAITMKAHCPTRKKTQG